MGLFSFLKKNKFSWDVIEKIEELVYSNPEIPTDSPENQLLIKAFSEFPNLNKAFDGYGSKQNFKSNLPVMFAGEVAEYTEYCFNSDYSPKQAAVFIVLIHIFLREQRGLYTQDFAYDRPDYFWSMTHLLEEITNLAKGDEGCKRAFMDVRNRFEKIPFSHETLNEIFEDAMFREGFI